MRILVTGGAGFIGSSLCECLVKDHHEVVILDDFSSGSKQNLKEILNDVELIKGSCLLESDLDKGLKDIDAVIHLAANPEVRLELNNSVNCFNRNVLSTYKLLEVVKNSNVETIMFSSASPIYGRPEVIPTPTAIGENLPISIYAGSKLASESLISAYSHSYDKKAIIVRLANIVGPRSNHGVVFDFVKKLKIDKRRLNIFGDGNQKKSYLYIDDLVNALLVLLNSSDENNLSIYNIGSVDQITVTEIAKRVIKVMKLGKVDIKYTGGTLDGGGWNGDVTNMLLDISKMLAKGWKPVLNSGESIERTVKEMCS